jgi:hypothetical protein
MNPDPVVLNISQTAIQGALTGLLVWWMAQHPNRSKENPDHQRMPKLIKIFGWVFIVLAIVFARWSLSADEVDDLIGMRVFSFVWLAIGGLLLALYRNWYLAPAADEVTFRTGLGRERRIIYSDIAEYRTRYQGSSRRLTVRSSDGTKLAVNLHYFDMSPLLAAIAFKEKNGRWPLRGELTPPTSCPR